jgi:hypothetical protein
MGNLKPVAQIAPLCEKARNGHALRIVRKKGIDLIELVGCDELQ